MNRPDQTHFARDLVARVLDSLKGRAEESAEGSAVDGLGRLWESWSALNPAERDELAAAAEAAAADSAAPAAPRAPRRPARTAAQKRRTAPSKKAPVSMSKRALKSDPPGESGSNEVAGKREKKKDRKDRKEKKKNKKKNRMEKKREKSKSKGRRK
jgi:DNA-binding SARP family transcriptional activator